MTHDALKVVIITEKLVAHKVAKTIEECGASGYTIMDVGGKGSRGARSQQQSPILDNYANVKIEVITTDKDVADKIAHRVAQEYFLNYAGITYIEGVQILRPQKF